MERPFSPLTPEEAWLKEAAMRGVQQQDIFKFSTQVLHQALVMQAVDWHSNANNDPLTPVLSSSSFPHMILSNMT